MFIFFLHHVSLYYFFFFVQAEDGIRDATVTGVQTCALPILAAATAGRRGKGAGGPRGRASRPGASGRSRHRPGRATGARTCGATDADAGREGPLPPRGAAASAPGPTQ